MAPWHENDASLSQNATPLPVPAVPNALSPSAKPSTPTHPNKKNVNFLSTVIGRKGFRVLERVVIIRGRRKKEEEEMDAVSSVPSSSSALPVQRLRKQTSEGVHGRLAARSFDKVQFS